MAKTASAISSLPINAVPIPVNSTTKKPTWDGTYPELLAADALLECTFKQSVGLTEVGIIDSDLFLRELWADMGKAMCAGALPTNPAPPLASYITWVTGRANPACNVDPTTNEPKGIEINVTAGSASGFSAPYSLPQASDYAAASSGPAFTGAELSQARNKAQDQVHYAWVNLCMAQKLRAHLESIQVAFASEADLLQLQSIIRERAGRAVFQYTTIIKTIDGSAPSTAITNPWQFPAFIRYWKDKDAQWSTKAARLGQDFASAVQLLVDVSREHTETLVRTSSTKPGFGEYDSTPVLQAFTGPLDSGLEGARMDALAASYGQVTSVARRGVVTDMKAPEIGVLLGLARAANALQLTGANKTFSLQTNATNLLFVVERYVRQRDCIARGDLSTACYTISSGLPTDQYVIRKRHNIQLAHASALVEGLLEHVYGQPGRDQFVSGGPWTYRFDTQDVQLGLPLDLSLRVIGTHTYSGDFSSAGGGTLTLDPTSSLQQLGTPVLQAQAWSYIPAPGYNFALHPYDQGYALRGETNAYYRYGRQQSGTPLGSQNVLTYARYATSRANVNANAIIAAAGSKVYRLLENAVGVRQAVIRRQLGTTISSSCGQWGYMPTGGSTFTTPSSCTAPADVTNASGILLDVFVNTKSSDLSNRVARHTITNPVVLPASTAVSITSEPVDSSIATVTGDSLRRYTMAIPANDVADLRMLDLFNRETPMFRGKLEPPLSHSGALNQGFMPIITFLRPAMFGRVASFGGTLNTQLERAWEFQENEWSRPTYDGLEMRTDWAPVGDASLHGGQVGEEAYQYFLRAAADAAKEASSAIDKAFELLSVESQDALALKQAEDRGKTLTQLEEQAYCGNAAAGQSTSQASCSPTFVSRPIAVPTCPAGVTGLCTIMRDGMVKMLGPGLSSSPGVLLANEVDTQRTSEVASFSRYSGGKLEGLLLAQWSAWKALDGAMKTALEASAAAENDVIVSVAEKTAADAQFGVDMATALTNLATALAGNATAQSQINQLNADRSQYYANIGVAAGNMFSECSDQTRDFARDAGYTYSPRSNGVGPAGPNNHSGETHKILSFNNGSWYAFFARCDEAKRQFEAVKQIAKPLYLAIDSGIDAAQQHITANNLTAHLQVPAQLRAAQARFDVAPSRVTATRSRGGVALAVQQELVQRAIVTLLDSSVAIYGAGNQAQLAKARIDLEKTLEVTAADNRFNLRRTYRSYDLWRARALAENARRLAVAARRAIESRFVVDLSTLKAPETFVEAPALWADEIFGPDLKPPSVLGRTAAPSNQDGLYSSKLVDYVNNLELFVNGYAIERPAATVRSDTEVVQLPGPASVDTAVAGDGTVFDFRDVESAGWSFYCANTATWTRHPQSATFDPSAWTLATMCGGQPPTRARLGFWLDPWGRFLGAISSPPFNERHNARWHDFALNLVGSGVRDCSAAVDAQACYAEPFIRYSLKHVGPVLVSDYDRTWVSMDVPAGVVEGGKALASEEWLDPAANGFQNPVVLNVARQELAGRPLGGAYELTLELTPDVRPERIERIQVLLQSDYWVRQQ